MKVVAIGMRLSELQLSSLQTDLASLGQLLLHFC